MKAIETFEQIKKLVEDKVEESKFMEFKQEISDPHEITKEVTAFSNADGGELVIGIVHIDGIAIDLKPMDKRGAVERFAQIIEHNTEPKLESFTILGIDDDNDESKGYVVVRVGKSPRAPHMDTKEHRYYIRRDRRSVPMLDNEIKILLLRRGYIWAISNEIKTNLELANKTIKHVSEVMRFSPMTRVPPLYIPLKIESWRAFQFSGYASILAPEVLDKLVNVYNLIDEVNKIIEFTNTRFDFRNTNPATQIITTPVGGRDPSVGAYVPALIGEKLQELARWLTDLGKSLGGI